jgi:hypothetical protein
MIINRRKKLAEISRNVKKGLDTKWLYVIVELLINYIIEVLNV